MVSVLDQTRLPSEEVWLELTDLDALVEAIASLRVRGAPLIGIVAAYGLAAMARRAPDPMSAIEEAAPVVRAARPTAVNLARAVDRVAGRARAALESGPHGNGIAEVIEDEAVRIHRFEIEACQAMGKLGAALLAPGSRVLTICNTGALATGGIGTAMGVIRTAFESGLLGHAWVAETRPLLQGSRLTAWELDRLGVPFRVLADAASGSLFARGLVDAVVVGADRIAANGDTANKIGTYVLAVLAARHGVPFYVVAPTSTIDPSVPEGSVIPIEERDPGEVRRVLGRAVAPDDVEAANPAFDVTPAELIAGIVTESEVLRPPYRLG